MRISIWGVRLLLLWVTGNTFANDRFCAWRGALFAIALARWELRKWPGRAPHFICIRTESVWC